MTIRSMVMGAAAVCATVVAFVFFSSFWGMVPERVSDDIQRVRGPDGELTVIVSHVECGIFTDNTDVSIEYRLLGFDRSKLIGTYVGNVEIAVRFDGPRSLIVQRINSNRSSLVKEWSEATVGFGLERLRIRHDSSFRVSD